MLYRLALEKYRNAKPSTAVQRMFTRHFLPCFTALDSHAFRLQHYWNEQCDKVVKQNLHTLKDIFNQFTTMIPNQDRFMRLQEFVKLVGSSGVVSSGFGAKEIGPLFNVSMQTCADEIHSERHMKMGMVEFVEALARTAHKIYYSDDAPLV